jgi:hypothetical protein
MAGPGALIAEASSVWKRGGGVASFAGVDKYRIILTRTSCERRTNRVQGSGSVQKGPFFPFMGRQVRFHPLARRAGARNVTVLSCTPTR